MENLGYQPTVAGKYVYNTNCLKIKKENYHDLKYECNATSPEPGDG